MEIRESLKILLVLATIYAIVYWLLPLPVRFKQFLFFVLGAVCVVVIVLVLLGLIHQTI